MRQVIAGACAHARTHLRAISFDAGHPARRRPPWFYLELQRERRLILGLGLGRELLGRLGRLAQRLLARLLGLGRLRRLLGRSRRRAVLALRRRRREERRNAVRRRERVADREARREHRVRRARLAAGGGRRQRCIVHTRAGWVWFDFSTIDRVTQLGRVPTKTDSRSAVVPRLHDSTTPRLYGSTRDDAPPPSRRRRPRRRGPRPYGSRS